MPNIELIQGDCLEKMKDIPDGSIDMVLTSPPYDNLRDYKGYTFDFEGIAMELYRVVKDGGVVVWVVGDSYDKNGSETLNSFKQALFFKEIGFNVHDTMIYQKNSYPFPPVNRYYQQFEYMFVFSKGKPQTYNIQRQPTDPRWRNKDNKSSSQRNQDGTVKKLKYECGKADRKMDNVWLLNTGYMKGTPDKIAFKHPATFPDLLAERHILSWSNEGDTILDPMAGSGTTLKMAKKNNRNCIGIEISPGYIDIIKKRLL
jgi:DNA modification methylase